MNFEHIFKLENGHKIPKGTMIFPNLHRITRNSEVFDDPSSFKPERFIDRDGKYCKNEHNIPFSIGMSYCVCCRSNLRVQ